MGFLDKAKAAAEQAATKAKEGVQDVQLRRELGQEYEALGKTTFQLVESGELSHTSLTLQVDRIRALKDQIEAQREPAMAGTATTSSEQSPTSDQSPSTPT